MPEDPSQPKPTTETNPEQDRQEQLLANVEAQSADTFSLTDANSTAIPTPQATPSFTSPASEPKGRSKKGLIIGLAVAAVLVVLGGGSAFAYTFWYQNPEKVVADGILSVMNSRTASVDGTMTYTTDDTNVALTLSGRGGMQDGGMVSGQMVMTYKGSDSKLVLEGEGMYAKNGDVYLRAKNLTQTLDKFSQMIADQVVTGYKEQGEEVPKEMLEQMKTSYKQMFQPITDKIDDKWIKISVEDMKETDEKSSEEYKCVQDNTKKIYSDPKTKEQIMSVYGRNAFLVVKEQLGVRDGSLGYVVDIDDAKAKKFGEEIEQLQVFKDIEACSKADDSEGKSEDKTKDETPSAATSGRVELWMDQWSHALTRVKGDVATKADNDEQKMIFDFKTRLNQPFRVVLPEEAMTIDELNKEMESVMGGIFGAEAEADVSSRT